MHKRYITKTVRYKTIYSKGQNKMNDKNNHKAKDNLQYK